MAWDNRGAIGERVVRDPINVVKHGERIHRVVGCDSSRVTRILAVE